jgi:hypothetical protein
MLPFNPSSELARAANPELDLVGGYQHRSEADSSRFLISARYRNRPPGGARKTGRVPHDITVSYSLFGGRACCIMEWAVEEA